MANFGAPMGGFGGAPAGGGFPPAGGPPGGFGGGFPAGPGPVNNNSGPYIAMTSHNGFSVYAAGFQWHTAPDITNYPTGTWGPDSTPKPPIKYCTYCQPNQSGRYKTAMQGYQTCQACHYRAQGYTTFCAQCDDFPVQIFGERCGICIGWCSRCTTNARTTTSPYCVTCQAIILDAPTPTPAPAPAPGPVPVPPPTPGPVPVAPPPAPTPAPLPVPPPQDPTICKICQRRAPNQNWTYCQRCYLEKEGRACSIDPNCMEEVLSGTTFCDFHTQGPRCRVADCSRVASMGTLCRKHYKEGVSLQLLVFENTTHHSLRQQFSQQLPTPGARIVGIVNITNVESNRRYQPIKERVEAEFARNPQLAARGPAQKRVLFVPNSLRCDIMNTLQPCGNTQCGVCSLVTHGFTGSNIAAGQYGNGLYFTWKLSQAHSGNPNTDRNGIRCVVVALVAAGHSEIVTSHCPNRVGVSPLPATEPVPYHSVIGREPQDRNQDKLVVYAVDQAVPAYLIFYSY